MIKKTKRYSMQLVLLLFTIYTTAQTPATILKGNVNTPYTVTGNVTLTATQSIVLSPNTHIKPGSTFVAKIISDAYIPLYAISNENFILTRKYQTNLKSSDDIVNNFDVIENIIYHDGLGRPIQNVAIKASPGKSDIITHISYDNIGRQEKDFLPYMDNVGSVASYRNSTDAETRVNDYYKSNYPQDIDSALPNPFSQKKFEDSPLSRVLLQSAPGKDWALNKGHEIKLDYQTNNNATALDNVKLFVVSTVLDSDGVYVPTPTSTINYSDNQLYKTITKDENWVSGKNNTIEEFRNKEGQIVLKRTYSDYSNISQTEVKHDTYYLYDIYGNLTYVLPPKAEGLVSPVVLKDLCYQYRYDKKNRLVEKKLPGKEWEYIVYDKLDRPILTQDANLRTLDKWLFTKYDAFGRTIYTGEYINTTDKTRALVQKSADNSAFLFEKKQSTSIKIKTTDINYSNSAFPVNDIDLFTINYYDDYLNINLDGGTTTTSYGLTPVTNPKELSTCTKSRILETDKWITYVNYYDKKDRLIYNYNSNPYQSVVTTLKTQFDFGGKVLETTSSHKKTGSADIVIIETFTYDHMGRLLTTKHKINNLAQETLSTNTYDNIGQLNTKDVGGTGTSIQKINFNYNIRGWLTGINDINSLSKTGNPKDLFAFKVNYNTTNSGISNVVPLYNGNIAETYWSTNSDAGLIRNYGYKYDNINRLKESVFKKGSTIINSYNETLTYDKNGNILSIVRNGENETNFEQIDNLTYNYENNTNKLLKVVDNAPLKSKISGFNDSPTNNTDDYSYDSNGNMITDNNKSITSIKYNHLNLPTKITFSSYNLVYVYNSLGQKIQKIFNSTTGGQNDIRTTDYLDGFQYESLISPVQGSFASKLLFFPTSEGYIEPITNSYKYIYQYKDHLGNVRLSYDKTLIIQEENNYYPFGLKQYGYNNIINSSNSALKYKYNGQELQEEIGLNMTAMDYRQYDNALGRFNSIDALSEMNYSISPFAFSYNNPIFWSDPTGLLSQEFVNSLWDNSAESTSTLWLNDGGGTFSKEDGSGMVNQETGEFTGFDSLRSVTVTGRKTSGGGSQLDGNIGGLAQSKAYSFGKFYDGWRSDFRTKQIDDTQAYLDGLGTADPTGIVDGINAIGYLLRGQTGNAAIAAIAIIPYVGDAAKGAKYSKGVLTASELLRIENAATRIGKPITVVGSRATPGRVVNGINTVKGTISDWDYVIEGGINSKQWSKIKNSMPGAKSTIDNMKRSIDIFSDAVKTDLPHITINPRK